jgi:hypothetical protein
MVHPTRCKHYLKGVGRIKTGPFDFAITRGVDAQIYQNPETGEWHFDGGGGCTESMFIINDGLYWIEMRPNGQWAIGYDVREFKMERDGKRSQWRVPDPNGNPFRHRLCGHWINLEKSKGTPLTTNVLDHTKREWK